MKKIILMLVVFLTTYATTFAQKSDNFKMKATVKEVVEINQTIALFQQIIDKRDWDRANEVLTEDALYDCSIYGFAPAKGIDAIRELFKKEGHAKAHHTTNTYVYKNSNSELIAESKVLGLLNDGKVGSVMYIDKFRKTPSGWRLYSRVLKF